MRLGVAVTLIATMSAAVLAAGLSLSEQAVLAAGSSGTNTVITSSANPATYGATVTLTATVTGAASSGAPTGTVAFTDGSSTALTCGVGSDSTLTPISSSASSATCLYTPPAVGGVGGTFGTIGTYSGDSSYATSAGSLAQEVLGTLATVGHHRVQRQPVAQRGPGDHERHPDRPLEHGQPGHGRRLVPGHGHRVHPGHQRRAVRQCRPQPLRHLHGQL